jgi:hypothetical protein
MTRRYTVTTYYEEEKKSSSLFGTCLCIMLIVTIAGFENLGLSQIRTVALAAASLL